MGLLVNPVQPDLSREGDQGRAVGGSVGRPEQEVDRPWPERRRAYPGLSRQTAVDLGHERRGLLVADEDVPDLRAVQRVHQVYILLTWDAEDVLYTSFSRQRTINSAAVCFAVSLFWVMAHLL